MSGAATFSSLKADLARMGVTPGTVVEPNLGDGVHPPKIVCAMRVRHEG